MVFPNLGYKKDTFLELSLVSNNLTLHPNKPKITIPLILALPCLPITTPATLSHLWLLGIAFSCLGLVFILGLEVATLWTNWVDRCEQSTREGR